MLSVDLMALPTVKFEKQPILVFDQHQTFWLFNTVTLFLLLAQPPFNCSDLVFQAQSVLVLRLCGTVLAHNVPDDAERTEFANGIW